MFVWSEFVLLHLLPQSGDLAGGVIGPRIGETTKASSLRNEFFVRKRLPPLTYHDVVVGGWVSRAILGQ